MKKKDNKKGAPAEATAEAEGMVQLQEERDRLEAQLKRTMADLANIRKRHLKELEEARARSLEALAGELLPVVDNFHLALAAHEQHESGAVRAETHSMVEGLQMVRSLLEGVLERHGLVEIKAEGAPFDPNLHEAVGVDNESNLQPGVVSKVMLRGYSFRERVLRPSKVQVAGQLSENAGPADQKDGDRDSSSPQED